MNGHEMIDTKSPETKLVDKFGRQVTYVRISVTDRCDFRCVYCMDEEMSFLPRADILSLEEIGLVAQVFSELGVSKIRLTGGEPLIRNNVMSVIEEIGALPTLNELVLTTNGSQLTRFSGGLVSAGVKRINISLDSLKPDRFRQLTRTGSLDTVLSGIDAAIAAGFSKIKLNAVILKGRNDDEIIDLVKFAREKHIDISFIEEMPLGAISSHDRGEAYCSSDEILKTISEIFPLTSTEDSTGGPSKYYAMTDSKTRIGFISPHSHNFCGDCNRVRVTVEGRLLLCLGNEHSVDLKDILRSYPGDTERLKQVIIDAMDLKPERHHFNHDEDPQILRFMNMTGG
ncbi:GTP 3',8-cyclase MoaA [Alkalimarinus alittae]|uniref:GTP 3',8-cyclase n=1 Tax=Alkalimarinus alittae TaxID=2961619 RepID=A0ABY6N0C6_9ALTE|nr:GTP 3',8-cyclase MoaA [Alkalimarinus alittae]UZE95548.1 GTP 3',8-cyclase MoaA [Alkalimarinus alittae]